MAANVIVGTTGEEQRRRRAGKDRRFRQARDGQTEGAISSRIRRQDLFGGRAVAR